MIALSVTAAVNILWWNFNYSFNIASTFFLIFSTALVFVIESRIRSHEVREGLKLLDSKRTFVRFIAHEIRTPLSTAAMGLELFHLGFGPGWKPDGGGDATSASLGDLQEYLALVQESIKVAESIFDNLIEFDLHGHEKDTLTLKYEATDAAELVTAVVAPQNLHARRSGVHLRVIAGAGVGIGVGVDVDRRRIAQALRALVATAIDSTEKNGEVTIKVRSAVDVSASSGSREAARAGRRGSLLDGAAKPGRRGSLMEKPEPTVPELPPSPPASGWRRPFLARTRTLSTSMFGESEALARFVVIEIAHGSRGFDKVDAKRINQETFTFNPNEIHGGGGAGGGTQSGLGMSLAKRIVEAHGGRVFVVSDGVGQGSTFVLGLPISMATPVQLEAVAVSGRPGSPGRGSVSLGPFVELGGPARRVSRRGSGVVGFADPVDEKVAAAPADDAGDVAALATQVSSSVPFARTSAQTAGAPTTAATSVPPLEPFLPNRSKGTGESMHVLVVEDSAVARTMLVKLLKTMKCTADEAEDGQQAVDKVKASLADPDARLYDMIMCDSVMPIMDGPTAVMIIRELGYDGPILGVTGNTLPEQVEDFVRHGADEVVAKPVKLPILKAAMARWSEGVRGVGVAEVG